MLDRASDVLIDPNADDEGIGTLITRAIDDAKSFAHAEIAVYRAEFLARLGDAKVGIAFGAGAAVLAVAAIIALLVGLILTLAPRIGPGWATLVVIGVTLLIVGVLGKLAADKFGKMTENKGLPK